MDGADILMGAELTGNGCSPSMLRAQRKLLKAIKIGSLEGVEETLNCFQPTNCDVNFVSSSQKTALQLAVELKNRDVRNEIIGSLLSHGADLEFGLLHAVHDGSLRSVEVLLSYRDPSQQASQTASSVKRQGYVTPLIFAACLQNVPIVKLLLANGFTVADPHKARCSCTVCGPVGEKLGRAVFRLNRYRALASPAFIAASFLQDVQNGADPVHRAFVLSKELRVTAEQDYEFRTDYLELSDNCKDFAVALLNECRSMKEIRCVMEKEGSHLNILDFAINTGNEKFVSHPYSQMVLNSAVYRRVSFFEKRSSFFIVLMSTLLSVFYPVLLLIWCPFQIFFPSHYVSRMFHAPFVKFHIHCSAYQAFLFLLVFSALHTEVSFLGYRPVDWVVFLYVLGQLVEIISDVYRQGSARFFSNSWNNLATATVTSFTISYLMWWAARITFSREVRSMKWSNLAKSKSYSFTLISGCFFAIGILLSFVRNFFYFQASPVIGPLLSALKLMLIDVLKFFFFFIIVFFAFAVSFTKLYLQYENARNHFGLIPQQTNQTDSAGLPQKRFEGTSKTIFWSLFGDINREAFRIDHQEYELIWKTGEVLFGAFNVLAVLVSLNMLIAMMNETYAQISASMDTQWKFTRTQFWLNWVYKPGVLPPPFNLLCLLLPLRLLISRLIHCCGHSLTKFVAERPRSSWKLKRIDEIEDENNYQCFSNHTKCISIFLFSRFPASLFVCTDKDDFLAPDLKSTPNGKESQLSKIHDTRHTGFLWTLKMVIHVCHTCKRREVIRHLILRNLAKKTSGMESGTESHESEGSEEEQEKVTYESADITYESRM